MDSATLKKCLESLPIGPVRYLPSIDSTNDEASRWVEQAAPHLSLVIADEQTAGRGRYRRTWITMSGSALAFSLILRPPFYKPYSPNLNQQTHLFTRYTALGALAVSCALEVEYNLPVKIKWPNDLLVNGRKIAGVLAESSWYGEQLAAVVVGIGLNVSPISIQHQDRFDTPAACLEQEVNHPVSRAQFLRLILAQFLNWQESIHTIEFLKAWEERLAYRGEWVQLIPDPEGSHPSPLDALIVGLDHDGGLNVKFKDGGTNTLHTGEYRIAAGRTNPH